MKKMVYGSLFLLAACGGGGSSGGGGSGNGGGGVFGSTQYGTAAIAGLWDLSEEVSPGVRDELYLHIASDGKGTFYDYAGDTYDEWGNCYWIESGFDFTHVEKNTFKFGTVNTINVEAYVTNNKLTLKLPDVGDLDDDGNTTEILTEEVPKATNKNVANFKPECSDSMATARSLIPAKGKKPDVVLMIK